MREELLKSPVPNLMIEEYIINPNTMAIEPFPYGSKIYSKIRETEKELLSPFKPLVIVKRSCEFYGVSYEERRKGTRKITGFTHKLPITVDPINSIYFFPTASANNSDNIWNAKEHIISYTYADKKSTEVTYSNGTSYIIPISFKSFESQYLHTIMLMDNLSARSRKWIRKPNYIIRKENINASERKRPYRIDKNKGKFL